MSFWFLFFFGVFLAGRFDERWVVALGFGLCWVLFGLVLLCLCWWEALSGEGLVD